MKTRRKRFLGIVLISLALVSGGILFYAGRSLQLLQQAIRIPAFGGSEEIDAYGYEWVTPNIVLFDHQLQTSRDPFRPDLGPPKSRTPVADWHRRPFPTFNRWKVANSSERTSDKERRRYALWR